MTSVYIPANLDVNQFLNFHPPNFRYDIECFYYIIGLIVDRMGYQKDNTDEESDYATLNAQYIQRRIRNYHQYFAYLQEHGIIQINRQYLPGIRSRGYKLTNEYIQQDFVQQKLTRKGLVRPFQEQIEHRKWLEQHYGHLTKWFNKDLQIDYNGAVAHLERLYEEDAKRMDIRDAARRFHLRKIGLDKIRSGLFSYSVDATSGRFHSNLTTLKSELRNFITYEGQRLCSVDVKNSQPFISTIFFNPAFYEQEKENISLFSLSPTIYHQLYKSIILIKSIISSITNIIMLVKQEESQCTNDIELYCTLVDKGRMYQYFANKLFTDEGIKYNLDNPQEKRKLKDEFFRVLYSDNRFFMFEAAYQKRLFKRLFPTVYKIFNLIKKKGKQKLPVLLQLVESQVILKRVTDNISHVYPDLPLFTIHDSVVTLESHRDIVRQELKAGFEQVLGLQPTLSFESWTAAGHV